MVKSEQEIKEKFEQMAAIVRHGIVSKELQNEAVGACDALLWVQGKGFLFACDYIIRYTEIDAISPEDWMKLFTSLAKRRNGKLPDRKIKSHT